MTNIDHAAEVVYNTLSGKYGDFGYHEEVGQALADAGLLAPEPQVIRTRDELAALDPDTLLLDADDPWNDVRLCAHEWMEDYTIDAEGIFPLAVIATGDQVRAARQALTEAAK